VLYIVFFRKYLFSFRT